MKLMPRLKVTAFTPEDCDYLNEYESGMGVVAKALDTLQGKTFVFL